MNHTSVNYSKAEGRTYVKLHRNEISLVMHREFFFSFFFFLLQGQPVVYRIYVIRICIASWPIKGVPSSTWPTLKWLHDRCPFGVSRFPFRWKWDGRIRGKGSED